MRSTKLDQILYSYSDSGRRILQRQEHPQLLTVAPSFGGKRRDGSVTSIHLSGPTYIKRLVHMTAAAGSFTKSGKLRPHPTTRVPVFTH